MTVPFLPSVQFSVWHFFTIIGMLSVASWVRFLAWVGLIFLAEKLKKRVRKFDGPFLGQRGNVDVLNVGLALLICWAFLHYGLGMWEKPRAKECGPQDKILAHCYLDLDGHCIEWGLEPNATKPEWICPRQITHASR